VADRIDPALFGEALAVELGLTFASGFDSPPLGLRGQLSVDAP
jgi:hypothetical protein